MAFKLDSIFNSKTLSQANDSYKVQYIERSKIIPNEHNKEIYSTDKTLYYPMVLKIKAYSNL